MPVCLPSDQLAWWNFRVLYVSASDLIVNLPTTGLNLAKSDTYLRGFLLFFLTLLMAFGVPLAKLPKM